MRIKPPTPSGVAIGVALVVVLTAGAAAGQALITSADIKDNTIQSVDIKGGAVTSSDIKDGTVTSGDIKNGTIASGDIKDGTVTSGDIKNGTIVTGDIKDGTVTSGDIKNETIKSGDILNGTVNSADVKDNSLTAGDLAAGSVGTSELAASAVTNGKLAADAVGSGKIANETITLDDINDASEQELQGVPVVTAPGGGWSASPSPGLTEFTPDGVVFGPFTNSEQQFGGVRYEGTDVVGFLVRDIAELTYSAGFNGTSDEPPYLRILTDVNGDGFNFEDCCEPQLDDHEFLFYPPTQPGGSVGTDGRLIKYETTEGTWDYDLPLETDLTWDELVNLHGDEPIFMIVVTAGNFRPGTTDAFLNSFSYELAGSAPVEVSFSN